MAELALAPDAAVVAMDDPLTEGQAYARTLKFFLTMQALEHAKEFVGIGHVKTGAIVLDSVNHCSLFNAAANMDFGGIALAGKLNGVGE